MTSIVSTSLTDVTSTLDVHHVDTPVNWSLMLGMVVSFTVMVVGSFGNLLTVCTLVHQFHIPRKVRYIKDLTPDTVFIINLALADLCYSSISLPFMFLTYYRLYGNNLQAPWDPDNKPCMVSAFLRYTNAIAEWTTLGLMALERCVTIYNFRRSRGPSSLFSANKTVLYCVLIWIMGMMCQMPTLTGKFGEFAYNADYVKCDFTYNRTEYRVFSPRTMFFALESMVPCILILIGYLFILFQVHSSSNNVLSFLRSRSSQRSVSLRRSRTTRTIAKLLFVYLVCVIPICVYNISLGDNVSEKKELGIVLYCIYWSQYCINNFIYVVSNEKYRSAYCQFLYFLLCREIPKVALHPAAKKVAQSQQVFTVSFGGAQRLQAFRDSRFRTPSECEEARQRELQGVYVRQDDSPSSSISTVTRTKYLRELSSFPQQVGSEGLPPLVRSYSISLKSSSSTEILVRPSRRGRSFKKDLQEAGSKLKRTFSL
ncbi:compound eye opsin BCRH2 [Procambarus clarkii]|uniref:compound eye opsin BCRH2 n=1 Tax=Procambarus clarkii TaxID=6728 RepID=UPI001E6760BD|nr:G-protein coupled receptor moody-like [Procambarus clarkii]